MLKIRLSRAWKKNMPFFRVVLTEHTAAAKHWYKEVLGFYNPLTQEFHIKFNLKNNNPSKVEGFFVTKKYYLF